MTLDDLRRFIPDVPDFPKTGIVFKDITPLLSDASAFRFTVDCLAERLSAAGAQEILAIESRGFIFGAAVAAAMGVPLHLVRKPGRLPRDTVGIDYDLEYGKDRLELHRVLERLLPNQGGGRTRQSDACRKREHARHTRKAQPQAH